MNPYEIIEALLISIKRGNAKTHADEIAVEHAERFLAERDAVLPIHSTDANTYVRPSQEDVA